MARVGGWREGVRERIGKRKDIEVSSKQVRHQFGFASRIDSQVRVVAAVLVAAAAAAARTRALPTDWGAGRVVLVQLVVLMQLRGCGRKRRETEGRQANSLSPSGVAQRGMEEEEARQISPSESSSPPFAFLAFRLSCERPPSLLP